MVVYDLGRIRLDNCLVAKFQTISAVCDCWLCDDQCCTWRTWDSNGKVFNVRVFENAFRIASDGNASASWRGSIADNPAIFQSDSSALAPNTEAHFSAINGHIFNGVITVEWQEYVVIVFSWDDRLLFGIIGITLGSVTTFIDKGFHKTTRVQWLQQLEVVTTRWQINVISQQRFLQTILKWNRLMH